MKVTKNMVNECFNLVEFANRVMSHTAVASLTFLHDSPPKPRKRSENALHDVDFVNWSCLFI